MSVPVSRNLRRTRTFARFPLLRGGVERVVDGDQLLHLGREVSCLHRPEENVVQVNESFLQGFDWQHRGNVCAFNIAVPGSNRGVAAKSMPSNNEIKPSEKQAIAAKTRFL